MQLTRAATAVGVVLGAMVLAQGGCEPQFALPDQSAEATPVTEVADPPPVMDVGDVATEIATQSAVQPVITPAPGLPVSPVPSASASVVPKPSRAAANQSPTAAESTAALVAVSMAKSNRLAEVDPVTGKMARTVDLSEPAGSMTLAPDGHTAWVFKPSGSGSAIAILDLQSGNRHEDIHFRESDSPLAVAFSTDGSRAFVAIDGSVVFASNSGKEFGRVSVGQQTAGVQVPRRISSLAVSPGPGGDVVYAADYASGVVWALDAGSGALLAEIDVGGGPLSIIADPTRQRDYVLLDTLNQIVAIDTTTRQITNRLDLPATPLAAGIGQTGTIYVTGGDSAGELWVITPDVKDLRARVPIGGKPVGVALSSDGNALFVADAASNSLNIMSADTVQTVRSISLPSEPMSVLATRAAYISSAPVSAATTPTSAPSLVASPTPLPQGALPSDKLPAGAVAEPFVTGAAIPSALAFAPDGRLFYAELQTGRIRVVQSGALLPDPFYQFLVASQGDAGLLGLTLDPDFPHNHYLYALYTAPKTAGDGGGGAAAGPNEVVRLTDVDNKGTDLRPVLQDLPSVGSQHSAAIRFGPDGDLYVSVADDDKSTNAQDLNTLAGKILRVNPDGSVPSDNPFVGQSGKQDAIWAYGLRDAYSVAFHPVGHQLLAVDSAEGDHDALELVVRGGNYGSTAPLAVIKPSIQPTGSTFYLGDQLAGWNNDWFYCDAALKQLRRVHLASLSFDRVVFDEIVKQGCSYDVATGPDGALYYSDAQGIYRIGMPTADRLQAPVFTSAPAPGSTPPAN
jgi:glucose/arabinose dehydrogenase